MYKRYCYYFSTLCAYSPNLHKPYKKYLDVLAAQQNGDDFFGGVGSGLSDNSNNKDEDLSWLDNL